jgi:hypothetical protein
MQIFDYSTRPLNIFSGASLSLPWLSLSPPFAFSQAYPEKPMASTAPIGFGNPENTGSVTIVLRASGCRSTGSSG